MITPEQMRIRVRRLEELSRKLAVEASAKPDADLLLYLERRAYGDHMHAAACGLDAARRALAIALQRLEDRG